MTGDRQPRADLVFLLDVDNTLLDNDRLKADLGVRIEAALGEARAKRFWEIYEQVRSDEDYVDYPATLERMAAEMHDSKAEERLRTILDDISFRRYLYPGAMQAVAHMNTLGETVILSDGDQVFQRRKIVESGLAAAVGGRVLIVVHKEQELPRVFAAFPAMHYVVVDDKPRILAALERDCLTQFTTILVQQGKYAAEGGYTPKPDYTVPQIADLTRFTRAQLIDMPADTTGARKHRGVEGARHGGN